MENKDFKKKILITGGCGFIGSHLTEYLVRNHPDWLIVNLDNLTYAGVVENLKSIENEPNYVFHYGDICNKMTLLYVFSHYGITDIIHLAAESHVDNSLSEPIMFLNSNTYGTAMLLDTAKQYWNIYHGGVKGHRFYYFSTDEVFGFLNNGDKPFSEDTRLNPSSPYSASKAAGDLFVNAFHRTYGMDTLISHCCNVCGGRQFPEKLIPATIDRIINDEPIIIYDKGEQVREWIYIDDVLTAAMDVFEKGTPGEAYNIGSGNEVKNINLVHLIIDEVCNRTGKNKYLVLQNIKYVDNARPGHDFRYAINHDKLTNEIGWEPTTKIKECIEKTVNWYLTNEEWMKNIKNKHYLSINGQYKRLENFPLSVDID